jgi:hypothetical protein
MTGVDVGSRAVLGVSVIEDGTNVSISVGIDGVFVGIRVKVAVMVEGGVDLPFEVPQAESKTINIDKKKGRNVFMDKAAPRWLLPLFQPASFLQQRSGGWRCW